jgi:hypothetical protein
MSARGQFKGRKMLVKLIDGTKFVDVFDDQSSRHVIFKERGRIARDQIKKMSPYVEEGFVWITVNNPNEIDTAQTKEFPNLCPLRKWENTDPSYSGRNGFLTGFSGGHWENCHKLLDAHGVCPEHGKVRFTVTEAAREHKERVEKEAPSLRKTPPRRAGGHTRPRRMCR